MTLPDPLARELLPISSTKSTRIPQSFTEHKPAARGHFRTSQASRSKTTASSTFVYQLETVVRGIPDPDIRRWIAMACEETLRKGTRQRTAYALKVGKLKRKPCEWCGNRKSEAHHWDYLDPYKVTWLCRSCHVKAENTSSPAAGPEHILFRAEREIWDRK